MSWDYRAVMSGERKGLPGMAVRALLFGASIPYKAVVARRNRGFEQGSREVLQCGAPVISIGNLTTGGTGKTPIVCFLAKWFRDRGTRVAIVSRGYGRGEADTNDEALELHSRLPDVPHVQDPDRVQAAMIAVEELAAQVVLMDDGFQHRRLHRDLNFVVIDATCPFGYGHVLPRGLLREPISGLRRADLVIVTRCDAVDAEALAHIEQTVRNVNPSLPIVTSTHQPITLLEYPSLEKPLDLTGKRVCVVSAIGNPSAFEHTVQQCGAEIVGTRHLSDHDPYAPETVENLRDWVQGFAGQVDQVVCTHKDLVKLQTDRLGGVPLAAVMIDFVLIGETDALDQLLNGLELSAD